ncbi:S9 family peptidase [Psychrosphaera haliotis]|uniref:alpha/beta hydrolase family protein n=1 Tax=Psychrosphaera haliotis TaxID=555083 RepID=UPI0031D0FFC5
MRYLIALLIMCTSFVTFSSQPTVDDYAQLPSKSLLAISPSGLKLAYRDTAKEKDMLIIIDAATKKLISAANIIDINPNLIYFVSEETVVLTATKNIKLDGYKGRHDASWAYAFNIDSNKIHALLQQNYGIFKGQTQLGRVLGISKDKKHAYMPAYEKPGQYNLYKVDLKKRRKPKLMQRGTPDTDDFFINNNGKVIARERFNNYENLHRVEARIDDKWIEIYRNETEIKTIGVHGLTPSFKALVISAYSPESGQLAYYTMNLKDGAIGPAIFKKSDKSVERLLMSLGRTVYGAEYSGFTPSYEFFDKTLNARMRGITQALPNNSFRIDGYTPDWKQIILFMQGEFSSGDYVRYNAGGLEMLAPSRPEIAPDFVYDVVEYSFKARDGLTIPTLLTKPRTTAKGPVPAIIMPHGGPESYDKKGFDYVTQYFASQGYLVIQPQFRGSEGFGLNFKLRGRGEWGKKMQDDLTDAVHALVADNSIDKNRVCIVGASYGGYAALAGATFTPDLYKCVVSINGVSDVDRMMRDEQWDYGKNHWLVSYWNNVIANGNFDDDHLSTISPVNYAKKVSAPVLLIHGEHDEIVPVRQSKYMHEELQDNGKDVTFIELEEGDHYLSNSKNRLEAMRAIGKFVKEHI